MTIDRQRAQAVPRQSAPSTVYRGTQSSRSQYDRPGTYQQPRGYSRPQTYSYSSYNRGYRVVRQPVFARPYYTFRPRISIGFGISVGYGVSYPFQYYDPYGFYNFRIGTITPYRYSPGYSNPYYSRVGGISFDIDPWDADLFIDGEYVGIAGDFSPGQMPLTLQAGRHHVDLRADGLGPVSFDITVVAGQVIPYQGSLPY